MIVIIDLQRGIPSKRKSSTCIDYVPALCTHRPSLLPIEWISELHGLCVSIGCPLQLDREVNQTWSFRGSKSRNKVSVGEPAEGSLTRIQRINPILVNLVLVNWIIHDVWWMSYSISVLETLRSSHWHALLTSTDTCNVSTSLALILTYIANHCTAT